MPADVTLKARLPVARFQMSEPHEVSVLIPCFNEERIIERCSLEVAAAMPDAEIVVIHGGHDRCLEIARNLKLRLPQIVPVRNENDLGKGHAIRKGMTVVSGRVIVQFDADLQFAAADLPSVIETVRIGRSDVCLGSRFVPTSDRSAYRASFFRDTGNRFLSGYTSLLIGQRVTDVTAGSKAWTCDAYRQFEFRDNRYSYEVELIIRAAARHLRISEVPVHYASRETGASMHASNWRVMVAGSVIVLKTFVAWVSAKREVRLPS